jgi:hypothetical protein
LTSTSAALRSALLRRLLASEALAAEPHAFPSAARSVQYLIAGSRFFTILIAGACNPLV